MASRNLKIFEYALRMAAAAILLQTLFFKFSGAQESVRIFSTLGAEPFGRYASGVLELAAAVLLLIPAAGVYGAGLALLVMTGAVFSHLLFLGIDLSEAGIHDGGLLLTLALIVFVCSLGVLILNRRRIPRIGDRP